MLVFCRSRRLPVLLNKNYFGVHIFPGAICFLLRSQSLLLLLVLEFLDPDSSLRDLLRSFGIVMFLIRMVAMRQFSALAVGDFARTDITAVVTWSVIKALNTPCVICAC